MPWTDQASRAFLGYSNVEFISNRCNKREWDKSIMEMSMVVNRDSRNIW
jgi:hypothetical protein